MQVLIPVLLDLVFKTIVQELAGKLPDTLIKKMKRDPVKGAFKAALGAAVERYASDDRLSLALPLLQKKGLLTDKQVASELGQLLLFEREPDRSLIARKWGAALKEPAPHVDMQQEADRLISLLEAELRRSDVFRPAFQTHDLNQVALDSRWSAESLAQIENELQTLTSLLTDRFGQLIDAFAHAPSPIQDQIYRYHFAGTIREKTRGFAGRQWVFDAVERFMADNNRGYFFVVGDPGIGKTALAAQLVRLNGYPHHFNIQANGINRAGQFMTNICAQLIATYELNYSTLPPEATQDAAFLDRLLKQISSRLRRNQRCILVVDALDEASRVGLPPGANLLFLPITLPERVYVVVTMRDKPEIRPRVECQQGELVIKANAADNLADVSDFLYTAARRPGIHSAIQTKGMADADFVALMLDRSEGNFMYLHYVLPEIAHGVYRDMTLDRLPAGLEAYYESHWQRMRGADEEGWFTYKLPVLVALTVARQPISTSLIQKFTDLPNARIRRVLETWRPFLQREEVEENGRPQRRYRLYHESFFDFIAHKGEVEGERVDLSRATREIADLQWDFLFSEN